MRAMCVVKAWTRMSVSDPKGAHRPTEGSSEPEVHFTDGGPECESWSRNESSPGVGSRGTDAGGSGLDGDRFWTELEETVVSQVGYGPLAGYVTHSLVVQTWSASPAAMAGLRACQWPSASFTRSVRTGQQKL